MEWKCGVDDNDHMPVTHTVYEYCVSNSLHFFHIQTLDTFKAERRKKSRQVDGMDKYYVWLGGKKCELVSG